MSTPHPANQTSHLPATLVRVLYPRSLNLLAGRPASPRLKPTTVYFVFSFFLYTHTLHQDTGTTGKGEVTDFEKKIVFSLEVKWSSNQPEDGRRVICSKKMGLDTTGPLSIGLCLSEWDWEKPGGRWLVADERSSHGEAWSEYRKVPRTDTTNSTTS